MGQENTDEDQNARFIKWLVKTSHFKVNQIFQTLDQHLALSSSYLYIYIYIFRIFLGIYS